MAASSDLVINHLEDLNKHRALIACAYRGGSVELNDDPDHGRGIFKLSQARLLVPLGEGSYRLASSLSKYLDEVLRVDRLYSIVGADVAELDQRLPDIAHLVSQAVFDGRTEDADRYIDEFDRAVFALADSVASALQFLRILADNRFANVSTYVEKRKQNEFYLERVQRLSEALGNLQSAELLNSLEATPEGERMLGTYRSQIVSHLSEWRAQLLDITAILREYLFRTRQIEQLAKRMRSFELYLKRTPSYVPGDLDVFDDTPAWARRARGFALKAHAWVQNPVQEEMLFDIASSIPSEERSGAEPAQLGSLLEEGELLPEEEPEIVHRWQDALIELLDQLGPAPTSAVAWKASRDDLAQVPDDIWILCLLHEQALRRARSADVMFEPMTTPLEPLSGVIPVTDILLSKGAG